MITDQNSNGYLGYRAAPAIANSDLKYLPCPKVFQMYKSGEYERPASSIYQQFGTMFEDYLNFSGEKFDKKYIRQPDGLMSPSSPNQEAFCNILLSSIDKSDDIILENAYSASYKVSDKQIREGKVAVFAKELYDRLEGYINFQREIQSKIPYTSEDLVRLMIMKENLQADEAYKEIFHKEGNQRFSSRQLGIKEPITLWEIDWKGEIDYLIFNLEEKIIYLVDLKTVGHYLAFFKWDIRKYKYYRQLALYRKLLESSLKGTEYEGWTIHCRIMAVETVNPHEAAIIPIPDDILKQGEEELKEAAQTILWYRKNGWDRRKEKDNPLGLFLINWEELNIIEDEQLQTA